VTVSKAFNAASENAVCGAHQKGKVFKAHMFDIYDALIRNTLPLTWLFWSEALRSRRENALRRGLE
jgi:hypothetical protein